MPDAPYLLIVAGPNGSGKSTLTQQLLRDGIDLGHYINPDEIAKTLDGEYGSRVRAAQAIADRERAQCLERGVSFSFETVMSHPSKVELLRRARAKGYRVALFFVATESPDLNVARVRQRVALGGHDVPERKIRERYIRTLGLLPAAMALADEVVLFDNSYGRPAVLRPFFRRSYSRVTINPPIPQWGVSVIRTWMPR